MADICVRAKQIVGISFSSIQRFSNLLILRGDFDLFLNQGLIHFKYKN